MTTNELKQYIDKVLGNSIRCLLPSYWWKRLFGVVADKFDDVEKNAAAMANAAKMPIVDFENELNNLEAERGVIASVLTAANKKISECYFDTLDTNLDNYTRITNISIKATDLSMGENEMFAFSLRNPDGGANGYLGFTGEYGGISIIANIGRNYYLLMLSGEPFAAGINAMNRILALNDLRYVGVSFDTIHKDLPIEHKNIVDSVMSFGESTEAFIKNEESWDRLAKGSEIKTVDGLSSFNIYDVYEGEYNYDEKISNNKAAFSGIITAVAAQKNVYVTIDNERTVLDVDCSANNTSEMELTTIYGSYYRVYALYSDGHTELRRESSLGGAGSNTLISISNSLTFQGYKSAFANYGLTNGDHNINFYFIDMGWGIHVTIEDDRIVLIWLDQFGSIWRSEMRNLGEMKHSTVKGGFLYITDFDLPQEYKDHNINVLSTVPPNSGTTIYFIDNDYEQYLYPIISYKNIRDANADNKIIAYEVVIYREKVIETWRIDKTDGNPTLIVSIELASQADVESLTNRVNELIAEVNALKG